MITGGSERRQRVVRLTREGRSASEIAVIVGITKRSVYRIRQELGISQGVSVQPMTPEECRRAHDMLEDGCSYGEVARTLNRHWTTLVKRFPGYTWTREQTDEYRTMLRRFKRTEQVSA